MTSGNGRAAGKAPTRRALLAAATVAGLAAPPARGEDADPAFDLETPGGRLRAYMRMRGALDDRLVIGFLSGRYYGVVGDEVRPLYGVAAATFGRFRRRPDGDYDGATYEAPFFTDLESGAPLERWRNPYTGEDVAVPHDVRRPATIVISPDLRVVVAQAAPGLDMSDRVVSVSRSAADLWMTEETISAFDIPGAPRPFRYSEIVTLHARTADFVQTGAARAPCETSYTSVVSWRPWQKMGDRPGHLLGTGAGKYGVDMEAMPKDWLRAAKLLRPEIIEHPEAPLAGLLTG